MRLVVADTSPVFYLLSIDHVDLLPQLFEKILVPAAVHKELCHPAAPALVREWLLPLGAGEREAITLATLEHADLILIDERKGTHVALDKGFVVAGTLGVLALAALRGLIDLHDSFARLKLTNFRYRQEIMDVLLNRQES
jgi:predicted nucleic acid-binding protein